MALFKKEVKEIEALDKELERMHEILPLATPEAQRELWKRIYTIQSTLIEIARRNNGLEY